MWQEKSAADSSENLPKKGSKRGRTFLKFGFSVKTPNISGSVCTYCSILFFQLFSAGTLEKVKILACLRI
jgi:hypothetical protein